MEKRLTTRASETTTGPTYCFEVADAQVLLRSPNNNAVLLRGNKCGSSCRHKNCCNPSATGTQQQSPGVLVEIEKEVLVHDNSHMVKCVWVTWGLWLAPQSVLPMLRKLPSRPPMLYWCSLYVTYAIIKPCVLLWLTYLNITPKSQDHSYSFYLVYKTSHRSLRTLAWFLSEATYFSETTFKNQPEDMLILIMWRNILAYNITFSFLNNSPGMGHLWIDCKNL